MAEKNLVRKNTQRKEKKVESQIILTEARFSLCFFTLPNAHYE